MEDQNYIIKDIARMAGVSAGTVGRVLHSRGDVSPQNKIKVQKVLDEIRYQPNVFATGLAAKKKYSFVCLISYYIEHDYWHSVMGGVEWARQRLRPFNMNVDYLCYHQGDKESYQEVCRRVEESNVDAVLIAPNFRNETLALTDYLQAKKIAYALIDFNIEEANALTYIRQDSYKSGYIVAKILMRDYQAGEGQELVLSLSGNKNSPAEMQMQRRPAGFMSLITEEYEKLVIHKVVLNKPNQENNQETLNESFRLHPKTTLGVVFNSRVYRLGEYLRSARRSMKGLIGYDFPKTNVELLKSGDMYYLTGRHPGLQEYCGVEVLCDHVVFKKSVEPVKYMSIDIMIKEDVDFYFGFV